MENRGIIITHEIKLTGSVSGIIESQELRKHLLYWDFIDFPTVNGFGSNIKAQPEAQILKEQGFLLQSNVQVPTKLKPGTLSIPADNEELGNNLLEGQNKVYNKYTEQNIICSIAQDSIELKTPPSKQKEICVLEMELFNCLPYPSLTTHITDVLEFKAKRYDELQALRYKLDGFYLLATNNIDDLRTKNKAITDLKVAIDDINNLLIENKIRKYFTPFKVLLKIPLELFSGYTLGIEAAKMFNLPLFASSALGAATTAFLNLEPKKIFGPVGIPSDQRDFAYLFHANKELKMTP